MSQISTDTAEVHLVTAPVLMWHHIGTAPTAELTPYAVTREKFAEQVAAIVAEGYTPVTFEDLRAGRTPPRPIVFTFDDGYTSFRDAAMPVLAEHDARAVLFVVAGHLGGCNEWDRGATSLRLLDVDAVTAVEAAGHEIAVHGLRHRPMTTIDPRCLELELLAAKAILEDALGRPVPTMSYPNGESDPSVIDAVARTGFDIACLDYRPPTPDCPPAFGIMRVEVAPSMSGAELVALAAESAVEVCRREATRPVDWSFERLVERTLATGADETSPAAAWGAVHRHADPMVSVLRSRGVGDGTGVFTAIADGATTAPPQLVSALRPLAPRLEATLAADEVAPVWGAATVVAARDVDPWGIRLGSRWADVSRLLWNEELSRHPALVADYLGASGRPRSRTAVKRGLEAAVVGELAGLAADAHDRRGVDWDAVGDALARYGEGADAGRGPKPGVRPVALGPALGGLTRQVLRQRYQSSLAGLLWSLAHPAVLFAALVTFFGGVLDVGQSRYPLFVLTGFVPWLFVQRVVGESPFLVRGRGHLLKLSAFPRVALVLAAVLAAACELIVQVTALSATLLITGDARAGRLVAVPPLALATIVLATGVALVIAGLSVRFRDVANAVPLMLTVAFYAVPVVYPTSLVPDAWRDIYRLNPAVPLIECYRAALYGSAWPPGWSIAVSGILIAGLAVAAWRWFARRADDFVAEA